MKEEQGRQKKIGRDIVLLVMVCLVIGIYQIANMALISKDGAFYIEQARNLPVDPVGVVRRFPPGYAFLIYFFHPVGRLLTGGDGLQGWILTAQMISLGGRVLVIIPLYYLGILLVGRRGSFWGLLIMLMLPYPAQAGSDALRDWPHLLFVMTGLLFLIKGSMAGGWKWYGLAGICGGCAYLIRPEGSQIILYGVVQLIIWLLVKAKREKPVWMVLALVALLVGFALPAVPYAVIRGGIVPKKIRQITHAQTQSHSNRSVLLENITPEAKRPVGVLARLAGAFSVLGQGLSEDLMYYFLPAWLIGFWIWWRNKLQPDFGIRLYAGLFITLNIVLLLLLYWFYGYIGKRHIIPLIVLTVFFVPVGIDGIVRWIAAKLDEARACRAGERQEVFLVLVFIGLGICIPKLCQRQGQDMPGYLEAARWLAANSRPDDTIVTADRRVSFYAGRRGVNYGQWHLYPDAQFAVQIVRSAEQAPGFRVPVAKAYETWINSREKRKKIVIYRLIR